MDEEERVRQKLHLERGNADKRIKTLDEALAAQEDTNTKISKERKILEERLNGIMSNLGSEEEKVKSLSKQKNKYESIIADLQERLKAEQQVFYLVNILNKSLFSYINKFLQVFRWIFSNIIKMNKYSLF